MEEDQQSSESRYRDLELKRKPFLDRARECAFYTLPSLILPEGHTSQDELPTPYQSLGARGVNNLASKLLLTLLPPSSPFFRLTVAQHLIDAMQNDDEKNQFDQALSRIEQIIMTAIENRAIRVDVFAGLKHLIVAGNVLLYFPRKVNMRVFALDQYVASRDCEGNLQEIIIREKIAIDALPEEIQQSVLDLERKDREGADVDFDDEVDIYTRICLGEDYTADDSTPANPNRWYVHQEVKGIRVPHSDGNYPKDKLPWMALRWTHVHGEPYGRGHCEEFLGDLRSLETLSKAIVQAAALAARCVFVRNPNGILDAEDLENAENGEVIDGTAEDVATLQTEKQADMTIARQSADEIGQRLAFAFLLNSAIQRNGERVTAEEIRYMANELEDALGGVYSVMSLEFQLPLVELVWNQLAASGDLPALPDGVTPTIVTGVDALGRSHQLARLRTFMQTLVSDIGPQYASQFVNPSVYATLVATALGLDAPGLVRSQQEIQAQMQAQAAQQMAGKLGPSAIKAISDHSLAAQQQQPQQAQATEQ